jgi:hypothetical protein
MYRALSSLCGLIRLLLDDALRLLEAEGVLSGVSPSVRARLALPSPSSLGTGFVEFCRTLSVVASMLRHWHCTQVMPLLQPPVARLRLLMTPLTQPVMHPQRALLANVRAKPQSVPVRPNMSSKTILKMRPHRLRLARCQCTHLVLVANG